MSNEKKLEVDYYEDIKIAIERDMNSNFAAAGRGDIEFFWGSGNFKTRLLDFVARNPKCACAEEYAKNVNPLDLDIFALITDGVSFRVLILEVKIVNSCGLSEWSQLLGYCLVANARYGLLINIDGLESKRLTDLIRKDNYMSNLCVLVNGAERFHKLGCMHWMSLTQCLEYSNLGHVRSLAQLSEMILNDFL